MPRHSRKNIRRFNDLPGLFDQPVEGSDMYHDLVHEARSQQITPRHTMKADELIQQSARRSSKRTELEFISFGSGSSGNCAYLGIRGVGGILIDAGIDSNKVKEELARNYIQPETISGIILTHDHSDHVRFAYSMLRAHRHMKLFCTPSTLKGILRRHSISNRIKEYHHPVFKEFEFVCGPFRITPFDVSHDGTDNVGYSIAYRDKRFVVATDMGTITDRADFYMRQANYMMFEANYDERMLTVGRYPEYLKARIRSDIGHLNNAMAARYLADIYTPNLDAVYLCHLSHDNNTPEIALREVRSALEDKQISVGDASGSAQALACDVQLFALPRFDSSPLFIHRMPE